VFIFITVRFHVGLQIARHQPEAVECWKRSIRNFKYWKKTSKDKDDDAASEQRRESRIGVPVTTCIRTILHWVGKIRPLMKIVLLLSMIITVLITLRMVFYDRWLVSSLFAEEIQ
jgi:hypothetical protein